MPWALSCAKAESGFSLTSLAKSRLCIPSMLSSRMRCTEAFEPDSPLGPERCAFENIGNSSANADTKETIAAKAGHAWTSL